LGSGGNAAVRHVLRARLGQILVCKVEVAHFVAGLRVVFSSLGSWLRLRALIATTRYLRRPLAGRGRNNHLIEVRIICLLGYATHGWVLLGGVRRVYLVLKIYLATELLQRIVVPLLPVY